MSEYDVLLGEKTREFLDVADEKTERICTEKLGFWQRTRTQGGVVGTKRNSRVTCAVTGFECISPGPIVAHLARPRTPVPSAHSKHAPSEIVRTVKSITAREMWEPHEPFLEEYLWGGGFWEKSYYVRTAGDVLTDTIEQYIERTEHV